MGICQDLKKFLSLSPKRKIVIGAILIFAFLLGLGGVWLFGKIAVQKVKLPVGPKVAPQILPRKASFSLVPQSQTIKLGEAFIVGINFDSGDYKVEAADCVLRYDPKVLMVNKVSPGLFFAEYPKKEEKEGKILLTGTIGVTGEQPGGVKGKGSFGSIEFKAVGEGSSHLEFVKEETIAASAGENVLGETQDGTYIVK